MKNNKKNILIIAIIGILVFLIAFVGINVTRNVGKSKKTVNTEEAMSTIEKYTKKINAQTADVIKSQVELDNNTVDELPDIDKNEITVKPPTTLYAEIFSTSEKCGKGKDGWINEVAEKFNNAGYEVNGQKFLL